MVIEMGSYLFIVVNVTSEELVMRYSITEADAKEIVISSKLNKGFNIGRKNVAELFLDDQHMSGFHAKISFLGDKFIIEDMSSTNGTWIRFSKPG
jgi:pSer/pThr/pTyr-binding forkhead associated (FHA) protein